MIDVQGLKGLGRRLGEWMTVGTVLACSTLGAEMKEFEGHGDAVAGVALIADGRRAASCGDGADRTVRVWELATGRELRLWDVATGDPLARLSEVV